MTEDAPAVPAAAAEPAIEPELAAPAKAEPKAEPAPRPAVPFWQRLREGLRFARCDDVRVQSAQKPFLASRAHFARTLERAAPLMDYVLEELTRRGLPAEYVFLPMIESEYSAIATRGNRPAGMWQLMPVTARGLGLSVAADRDERLDPVASTRAAVTHLDDLARRFDGDFALVTMAYNAGEYRVRGALRTAPRVDGVLDPSRLALSPITHAHRLRLEAQACLIRDAERHALALPALPRSKRLVPIEIDAPLDFALAAALAAQDVAAFRRVNAGHATRIERGRTVLVARGARGRFERLLAALPADARVGWTRAARSGAATSTHLAPALLAAINAGAAPSAWLVPARAVAETARTPAATTAADRHTVRPGESLWRIARRYGLSVAALLRWNDLDADALLRPGDVLRIAAPR